MIGGELAIHIVNSPPLTIVRVFVVLLISGPSSSGVSPGWSCLCSVDGWRVDPGEYRALQDQRVAMHIKGEMEPF